MVGLTQVYSSIEAPKVGTRFHHFRISVIATPNVRSTQLRIFKCIKSLYKEQLFS